MIHILIAEERRAEERAKHIEINNDLRTPTGQKDANGMPVYEVTQRPAQLHSMGERLDHPEDANILYAAEWDGRSPWVVVHKGQISDLRMAYMGWPMVTQAEWEAAHPPVDP